MAGAVVGWWHIRSFTALPSSHRGCHVDRPGVLQRTKGEGSMTCSSKQPAFRELHGQPPLQLLQHRNLFPLSRRHATAVTSDARAGMAPKGHCVTHARGGVSEGLRQHCLAAPPLPGSTPFHSSIIPCACGCTHTLRVTAIQRMQKQQRKICPLPLPY